MFFSYAQNFEDVMLTRALREVERGFYIDVGAQDPVQDSVSKAFYEKGWRGFHVEPNVQYSERIRANRPDETVLSVALGQAEGLLKFYEFADTGLSTLDQDIAKRNIDLGFTCVERILPVITLDALLAQVQVIDIHWLKIDVEGAELAVIQGWTSCDRLPWIVVIESTLPLTQEQSFSEWEPLLLQKGYVFVYFDGLNRYYVSPEHTYLAKRFGAPPNVFDEFRFSRNATQVFTVDFREALKEREDELENVLLTVKEMHSLREESARLHEEIAGLQAEVARLHEENSVLHARLGALEVEQACRQSERVRLWKHLEGLELTVADERRMGDQRVHQLHLEIEKRNLEQEAERVKIRWLEKSVNDLHAERDALLASTSWRLTSPLRRLKTLFMRAEPRLDAISSAVALPVEERQSSIHDRLVGFIPVRVGDVEIRFSEDALQDSRGIGRVSRELLNGVRRSSIGVAAASKDVQKVVHFYSSIHWCPNTLPEPSVVMVHDVIPLLFQSSFDPSTVLDWRERYAGIARQAVRILTISHGSAADISRELDIPMERISVVYNGVTPLPAGGVSVEGLPRGPFYMYLGSFDHHKNLEVVLQALATPGCHDINLVLIGDNRVCEPIVHKLGLDGRVTFLGRLSDEEVGYVMARSVGLVFPSLYEGFGLPPLEAALIGIPSICSRRPAMTETLEGCALFAEPDDHVEWARHLRALVDQPSLRQELAAKARYRAGEFTWERSVAAICEVLCFEAR
ncbi:FkbM family methyltransferase [Xanthomonas sacchari]|uniref:FkbM family methyltransferase n=1 Tax=Xanthomonas sacchari TaxID=56458 RepID=UPI00225E1345|nr:FkbM family methyltransferase [Xanthomonas sacchari]